MKRWRSLLLLCAAICMIVPGCASGEQMDATLPSIQGGPTLFDFYDDPEIAAFAEHFYDDPPQSLTFAFHWFAASEYTVTDAETIAATFEALGQIVVGAQTNIVATDSGTYVV